MTAKELIERLRDVPEDMEVMIEDRNCTLISYPINNIEKSSFVKFGDPGECDIIVLS